MGSFGVSLSGIPAILFVKQFITRRKRIARKTVTVGFGRINGGCFSSLGLVAALRTSFSVAKLYFETDHHQSGVLLPSMYGTVRVFRTVRLKIRIGSRNCKLTQQAITVRHHDRCDRS